MDVDCTCKKHDWNCKSRANPLAWGSGHSCPKCGTRHWIYMFGNTECTNPNCDHVVKMPKLEVANG